MKNYNIPKGNWKRINGYEHYFISDDGRVYSTVSKRLLTIFTKGNGYKVTNLWKNNKGKSVYIHRLVLEHFCDETPLDTVNHIDGDKGKNHISNLEWATYTDNNIHALERGLRKSNRNNKRMSMPVEQRDLEGNLIKVYPSMRQAERETGVDANAIGHAIRKGWKYGGFQWFKKGEYKGEAPN